MFRFSIAVHYSPDGVVTPLVVSDNADDAIKARNECEMPGEIGVLLNMRPERLRKNRATAHASGSSMPPTEDAGNSTEPEPDAPKRRGRPPKNQY